MIFLAYLIVFFSIIQLLVAIANLFFKQDLRASEVIYEGLVSVLIPARNEEKNIGNLLNDLLEQNFENLEIIVFNDQSTDNTADIVRRIAARDHRIRLINSDGLPDGWLGKNYGCHRLSEQAKGDYLLFLDADVRVKNGLLPNTIAIAEKFELGLLSVFPKQRMETIGERLTVPNMNYILLTLLPLGLVLKSGYPSLAAANGQFMLFNTLTYNRYMPHRQFRLNRVEDIEIARYFKQNGISTACLTGDHSVSCRMYRGFNDAVNGFSKNVVTFFGNSYVAAIIFWTITTLGFIPVFIVAGPVLLSLYLLIILMTRVVVSIISRQNALWNLILLLPQQIAMGLFICKALINNYKKQLEWKGRNIL